MKKPILLLALLAGASAANAEQLTFDNGRLFLQARINGVESEALLDSGAEATLVDVGLAALARLPEGVPQTIRGSGGEQDARIVEGVTVEALGIELHPEAVVVLDLRDLSKRLINRPTRAILGRELFDASRLTIDIAGGRIERAVVDREPPGVRLPLTAHAGIESIPVKANGIEVQAEFDLGNGSGVLISRAMVQRLKLEPRGKETGGGIGGPITRDLVSLSTLEVAGRRFENVAAAVDDQPNANDLNIGTSVLRHFLITTDFKLRSLWLEPLEPAGR